jgi:hypothetical protein
MKIQGKTLYRKGEKMFIIFIYFFFIYLFLLCFIDIKHGHALFCFLC